MLLHFILALLLTVSPTIQDKQVLDKQTTEDRARSGEALIINKKFNKMLFVRDGEVVQYYTVATGKTNDLTPEGEFEIVFKAIDPYYIKGNIAGGDPKNPLGKRWMGFNALGTNGSKYGIHGNNNPDSIGKHISNGCIRMRNNEVEELYPQIPIGTKVIIVMSPQSLEEVARDHDLLK